MTDDVALKGKMRGKDLKFGRFEERTIANPDTFRDMITVISSSHLSHKIISNIMRSISSNGKLKPDRTVSRNVPLTRSDGVARLCCRHTSVPQEVVSQKGGTQKCT